MSIIFGTSYTISFVVSLKSFDRVGRSASVKFLYASFIGVGEDDGNIGNIDLSSTTFY